MHKLLTLAIAAAALASTSASAYDVAGQNIRPYIGADVGAVQADLKDQTIAPGFSASGGSLVGDNFGALSPHAGIEIGDYAAVELGYTKSSKSGRNINTPFGGVASEASFSGVTADLIGKYPVADKLAALGSVGVGRYHISANASGALTGEYNTDETAYRAGLGAQYQLTDNVAARAMVNYTGHMGNDVDHLVTESVGLSYRF